MARLGGRNLAISWIAGIVCVGIIGALIWFALPMVPVLAEYFAGRMQSFAS